MIDLNGKIAEQFKVAATEPASPAASIRLMLEFAQGLKLGVPPDYLALIQIATEIELVAENQGCIRIWSADGVVELNEAYEIQSYLPDALAIGDDEGGKGLLMMNGSKGRGLYRVPFADPDRNGATFLAGSLSELVNDGVGIDRLFD